VERSNVTFKLTLGATVECVRWLHPFENDHKSASTVSILNMCGALYPQPHLHPPQGIGVWKKGAAVVLPRRFVPECHYGLQRYNAWSLVRRYQFQPKCSNRILYSTTCRHSRRLQSQCAPPSASQTQSQNLTAKHGLTGQRQNLVLMNGRLLWLTHKRPKMPASHCCALYRSSGPVTPTLLHRTHQHTA